MAPMRIQICLQNPRRHTYTRVPSQLKEANMILEELELEREMMEESSKAIRRTEESLKRMRRAMKRLHCLPSPSERCIDARASDHRGVRWRINLIGASATSSSKRVGL